MNRTIKVFQTAPCGQRKFTMHRVVKGKVHCTVWSRFLHRAKNGTQEEIFQLHETYFVSRGKQPNKLKQFAASEVVKTQIHTNTVHTTASDFYFLNFPAICVEDNSGDSYMYVNIFLNIFCKY